MTKLWILGTGGYFLYCNVQPWKGSPISDTLDRLVNHYGGGALIRARIGTTETMFSVWTPEARAYMARDGNQGWFESAALAHSNITAL
jgi:hypothetical protein